MTEIGKIAESKKMPIKNGFETTLVETNEIAYMEKNLRMLNIYLYDEKINLIHIVYGKIDEYLEYLDDDFYRIHNSCIINLNMIKSIRNGEIILVDGTVLIVGINYYQKTRKKFNEFIKNVEKD